MASHVLVPTEVPQEMLDTPTKAAVHDIAWSNVNFKAGDKSILTDCWGHVPSGKVCAVLGPSGSGKSSLLNVMAGRQTTGGNVTIDGIIRVGNHRINPVRFRKNIAYVMQDDALMQTATPRECLMFSASMRLPASTPHSELVSLVDKCLDDLGLAECADVLVGGALIKGISGGQRKRTSVGVEIITGPTLLFLDEPTSGLDSHSASNLVLLLKKIASRNSAILCTIHQPSSEVFSLFDIVIFVKSGRIFYQGTVPKIYTYFGDLGHKCPELYNPADFVMNLCQSLEGDELERLFMPIPDEYLSEKQNQSTRQEAEEFKFIAQSSYVKQVMYLTHREFQSTIRNTGALVVRFAVTILLNLLYGLIFMNVGNKDNADYNNFSSHVGGITNCMISSMFATAQPVMLSFPFERPMFLREYSTGTYSTSAFLISKLLVEMPVVVVQLFIQWLLNYFLMDLQGNFFKFIAISFGLAMVSNSIGMVLAAGCVDVKQVTELSSLLFVPQILFMGFFVRISQIPVWLRWAQYLCGLSYATKLAYYVEFNSDIKSCHDSAGAEANCSGLLHSNGGDPKLYWVSILCLFGLFVIARSGSGYILMQKAKSFY